ncbi:hypothetical protein BC829DRAFT_384534 [Chytridium lagenaria]|nr:hypothetical protein BC829DRAFT_384534 [Chytridium lagenaria]
MELNLDVWEVVLLNINDRKTLKEISICCRTLNAMAAPRLWERFILNPQLLSRWSSNTTEISLHLPHIRSLDVTLTHDEAHMSALPAADFIASCPNLTELSMVVGRSSFERFGLLAEQCTKLRTLKIKWDAIPSKEDADVFHKWSQVENLHIGNQTAKRNRPFHPFSVDLGPFLELPRLKTLTITDVKEESFSVLNQYWTTEEVDDTLSAIIADIVKNGPGLEMITVAFLNEPDVKEGARLFMKVKALLNLPHLTPE